MTGTGDVERCAKGVLEGIEVRQVQESIAKGQPVKRLDEREILEADGNTIKVLGSYPKAVL